MTGPRFAYVDYCMCSGLAPYFTLCRHCSGYDINCQYRIHFKSRIRELQEQFPTLSVFQIMFFPYTLPGIGKFHAPAHTSSCRTAYSYNFLPGVGMTDGEALERIWSVFNSLALRTKEMSSGHRHDVINDFHSDMNIRRLHAMRMYYPSRSSLPSLNFREQQRPSRTATLVLLSTRSARLIILQPSKMLLVTQPHLRAGSGR